MIETAAHAMAPQAADPAFAAVIFDMDGVVTDTAGMQAAAWQAFFDQVLPLIAAAAKSAVRHRVRLRRPHRRR